MQRRSFENRIAVAFKYCDRLVSKSVVGSDPTPDRTKQILVPPTKRYA